MHYRVHCTHWPAACSPNPKHAHAPQMPGASAPGGSAARLARRVSAGVDARSWEVEFRDLVLLREIGAGSFGKVWCADARCGQQTPADTGPRMHAPGSAPCG